MATQFMRKSILAMALLLASAITVAGKPAVVIPKSTPGLRLKSVILLDDGKTARAAEIKGVLIVQASVRYGWFPEFESFHGTPILEIELSDAERKRLPYLSGWTPGHFDSFSINNVDEIVTALFDLDTLSDVREKRLLGVQREARLALSNIIDSAR